MIEDTSQIIIVDFSKLRNAEGKPTTNPSSIPKPGEIWYCKDDSASGVDIPVEVLFTTQPSSFGWQYVIYYPMLSAEAHALELGFFFLLHKPEPSCAILPSESYSSKTPSRLQRFFSTVRAAFSSPLTNKRGSE